jgi:preprotein translocase subunit SecF
MKPSKVGIVAVAILMVVGGVGFGIAQAGGTHSEQPVLSFEDMEALDQGSSSSSYMESRPVLSFEDQEATQVAISPADDMQLTSAGQEFVPEDNWSGTDWQTRGPVETGAIPGAVFEESWMKDYGND